MTGAVLLTMFGDATNVNLWHTDGDDPELGYMQRSMLALVGVMLILWALMVAPFTTYW